MSTTISFEELQQENVILRAKVEDYAHEISKLQQQLVKINKRQFGRKTEKLSTEERQALFFDFAAPEIPETEESVTIAEHKRVKRGRKPISPDVPRVRVEHQPEEKTCTGCGKELVKIGEEITEELDYVPARVQVIEHVKIKVACSCCNNKVITAKLPAHVQPLERSRPGVGLLTHIIISKYCDHLPLHRLEGLFARLGIGIARQRMCDWIGEVVRLVEPVYYALLRELLTKNYLQADETGIKVQDRDHKDNMVNGYFWGLLGPPNLVWFHYAPSRASDVPKELLKDYMGALQTDAYIGYNPVLIPDKVKRIACLAHIRRRFIESKKVADKECNYIVELISKLYKIEKATKDSSPEERRLKRQKEAIPILDKLFDYMQGLQRSMLPKHLLQDHLSYAVKQKEEVYRYTTDGNFQIDNNAIEGQIRPIAIGRKNYLFAGSHDGAHRAAVLYSLINSAKLCNLNPFDYLKDIIIRVYDPKTKLHDLLPHNWKPKPSSA